MAMSTGGKIAIGCVVVALLGGLGLSVVLIGGAWWVKGKVEKVASDTIGRETRIQELKQKVNATHYTPPADGVIVEDRLMKFLGVRQKILAVYLSHKDEFESAKKMSDAEGALRGAALLLEVQAAQAQAQADVGMSDAEYMFMVQSVYRTMWASEFAKESGKTPSQAADEAATAVREQTAQAEQEMARAAEKARAADGGSQAQNMDAAQKLLREGMSQVRGKMDNVQQGAHTFDVPPQNLALFRKHEAEIKRSSLAGLEFLGM